MNFIYCSENCKFQKDGYCCSEGNMKITNSSSNQCPFFCKEEKKEEIKKEKTI